MPGQLRNLSLLDRWLSRHNGTRECCVTHLWCRLWCYVVGWWRICTVLPSVIPVKPICQTANTAPFMPPAAIHWKCTPHIYPCHRPLCQDCRSSSSVQAVMNGVVLPTQPVAHACASSLLCMSCSASGMSSCLRLNSVKCSEYAHNNPPLLSQCVMRAFHQFSVWVRVSSGCMTLPCTAAGSPVGSAASLHVVCHQGCSAAARSGTCQTRLQASKVCILLMQQVSARSCTLLM